MRIAVLDLYTRGKGPAGPSVAEAVMAVQRQLDEHFAPLWGCRATLTLRRAPRLETGCFADDLGDVDGIIYISPKFHVVDEPALRGRTVDGASAFHYVEHGGIPCGFVFPEIAARLGVQWSVLLSHEILELTIDPDVNLLVGGVLPRTDRAVLVAYEICDPVQASHYSVDDVEVSNFVTPQYFKRKPRRRGIYERTNYLNIPLPQFDTAEDGCYWYFDPHQAAWKVYPEADYGPWKHARDALGDVPRTQRRVAKFLKKTNPKSTAWDTLWYGCADYSNCGGGHGGGGGGGHGGGGGGGGHGGGGGN